MFKVGDRVVYPMHGAGVIEAIEEKEVLGAIRTYYILRLPVGGVKLMVPTGDAGGTLLREVIGCGDVARVFEILTSPETASVSNWNRRYRANLDKIKTGDIFEVAEVINSLLNRARDKSLSTGERKMLESARQILISELLLVEGVPLAEMQSKLEELLA